MNDATKAPTTTTLRTMWARPTGRAGVSRGIPSRSRSPNTRPPPHPRRRRDQPGATAKRRRRRRCGRGPPPAPPAPRLGGKLAYRFGVRVADEDAQLEGYLHHTRPLHATAQHELNFPFSIRVPPRDNRRAPNAALRGSRSGSWARQPDLGRFLRREIVNVLHPEAIGPVRIAHQRVDGPCGISSGWCTARHHRQVRGARHCHPTTGAADGGRATHSADRSFSPHRQCPYAQQHHAAAASVTANSGIRPTTTGAPSASTSTGSILASAASKRSTIASAKGMPAISTGPSGGTSTENNGQRRQLRCLDLLGRVDCVAHLDQHVGGTPPTSAAPRLRPSPASSPRSSCRASPRT